MTTANCVRSCLVASLAVTAGLVSLACRPAPAPAPRARVRLTTGSPGAGFYALGKSLADAYQSSLPGLAIDQRESAGSVSNVVALQSGDADVGLAYADVAYVAFAGNLDGQPGRFDRLRGIAVLHLAPIHLVVGARSGIQDVTGLRGRRVRVGTPGSGTALTAKLVLTAFGIDPALVHGQPLNNNDAVARMTAGELDAMFVSGTDPVESVQAATQAGARVLPLVGPAIEGLRHEYPFFQVTVVPGRVYQGHPTPVRTIGVANLLLCREGLDEALVHDLTGRLFDLLPLLPLLRTMDLEQAPAVPIPLHDGAARFYRERELFR
jgi:uncharacterized protein